jgi:hypothetical protein
MKIYWHCQIQVMSGEFVQNKKRVFMLTIRCKQTMLISALLTGLLGSTAHAASHREAPLIAKDRTADITDAYVFTSYGQENLSRKPEDHKVTFMINVIPVQEPGSGANYFDLDDLVRYQFIVDNDRDGGGLDDIVYEVEFKTAVTNLRQFIRPVAGGSLPSAVTGKTS